MAVLIRGAEIFDGGGGAPFFGDVLVRGEKIEAVGPHLPAPPDAEVLDAKGRMLCPGFIDIHRHADVQPLLGWDAQAELRQGITTSVSGNCGISLTPSAAPYRAEQRAFSAAVLGPVPADAPDTYRSYAERLGKAALPLDFAAMIGTGAVRISLKGFSPAPFTAAELERAAACVEEALALGAPGVSCGMQNWGREIYRAIDRIEAARARGLDVTCDFYPYCGGSTMLTTMLPPALCADGVDTACARLGTAAGVEEFRRAVRKTYPGWDNYAVSLGWDRILVGTAALPENRRFLGLSVAEGARRFGFPDAEALAAHLMHTEGGGCGIINLSMDQADVDAVARLPYSMLISDALYAATDTPHPRLLGAFPRFLRAYAFERGVVTPQAAVRKMTALPAERFGFSDRGRIAPGCRADLLLFDPRAFTDNADFSGRSDFASGLSLGLIAGEAVVREDKLTGKRPGRWLGARK